MKSKLFKFTILISLVSLMGCSTLKTGKTALDAGKVKNIILFIGDGMGASQIYAGMTASKTTFYLESFPYAGFSKTYSFDNYITDSAAGGTALSTGTKTRNGIIGMGPDSTILTSIVEVANRNGLATGVVSTAAVTHATPASFIAHNSDRDNYEDIAMDFVKGIPDVFIGGGEDHFRKRKDGADLTGDLKKQGYDVVFSLEDLKKSESGKIAGLLAKEHMSRASQGRAGMLREMTAKAIETLSGDKDGFFLMVEGSMIDWGGHDKDQDYIIEEMIDLDEAIGAAWDFAVKDGETLIVVTADHETGGMALTGGSIEAHSVSSHFIESGNHTAVMVPVFSYGPGAEKFAGIHENIFFFNEFIDLLNINK